MVIGFLVWLLSAVLIACGYIFLCAYGATDHRQLAGQVLLLVGCIGLLSGLSTLVTDYTVVGGLLGAAVGIALDDKLAQKPLRMRMEAWLDKPHWKGPGPRNDAPPL
jgi:hypothetical protein